jgi:hypothetical protein
LYTIIDTFPAFITYWAEAGQKLLDEQLESWAAAYMSQWPEILSKQIENYTEENLDWRKIAREKVFPYLAERLPAMQEAHQNLLDGIGPIHGKAQQALGFDKDTTFVIYVGIGCGAGWATTLGDSKAVLFGLEAIAECGWSDPKAIAGLIAHEIGHLAHYSWRAQHGKPNRSGVWWQLYEEGFAQTCESRILNTEIAHQANPAKDSDWLVWCRDHREWLAAEFLRTVEAGSPVLAFFGSWFEISGKSETGYFLGREVVRELEKQLNLKEIALLDNIEAAARPILEKMAGRATDSIKQEEAGNEQ